MFDNISTDSLIGYHFKNSTKEISLSVVQYTNANEDDKEQFVEQIYYAALQQEKDSLPAYIAASAKSPKLLNDLNPKDVIEGINSINKNLDKYFDDSKDSFTERKDVMERVVNLIYNQDARDTQKIEANTDLFTSIINNESLEKIKSKYPITINSNSEQGKYNFNIKDTKELMTNVVNLMSNMEEEIQLGNFIFKADIAEDNMLRKASAEVGSEPRLNFEYIEAEVKDLSNNTAIVANELNSRYAGKTLVGPMLSSDDADSAINNELKLQNPNQSLAARNPLLFVAQAVISDELISHSAANSAVAPNSTLVHAQPRDGNLNEFISRYSDSPAVVQAIPELNATVLSIVDERDDRHERDNRDRSKGRGR